MSIADRIAAAFGYKRDPSPAPPWALARASAEYVDYGLGVDTAAGEGQLRLYECLSWIQIAISTVAQSAAGTPLEVRQQRGETSAAIANHPLEQLLQHPNPLESRFEFLESHYSYRQLTGNSYWWLNRSRPDLPPSELWIIPAHQMTPVPDGKLYLRGYLYEPGNGQQIPLDPWEVMHFRRWNPRSRFQGLSPLEALRIIGQADLAAQRYDANFYDKDNAKAPGALAWADPIGDTDWKKMQVDIREQQGGLKRNLMMLRNVGKGGVQWIQMAISQADMQFLEKRQFTKEEIFALYAPGLASALAINANEANAKSGDATLNARAIWPLHTATAEKITNELLPVYGDGLVAQFDDVRHKDRQLELTEQVAYERVHTVDEVRQKYYQSGPIGDERGKLLVAEVGQKAQGQGAADAGAPQVLDAQPEAALSAPQDTPDDLAALDLAKWERKSLKRLERGQRAACDFESEVLTPELTDLLTESLETATDSATVKELFAAAKRGKELNPDEVRLATMLEQALSRVEQTVLQMILSNQQLDLASLTNALRAILLPVLAEQVLSQASAFVETIGPAFDPALMHVSAATWANEYTAGVIRGLTATTKQVLERAITTYRATPGMAREQLLQLLRPAFGESRAEMIAITELTRAASQASVFYQEYLAEQGIQMEGVWQTAADERVCPICGPLHGQVTNQLPPAHPRCRCGRTLRRTKA